MNGNCVGVSANMVSIRMVELGHLFTIKLNWMAIGLVAWAEAKTTYRHPIGDGFNRLSRDGVASRPGT